MLGPLLFLIFINDVTHVIDHTDLRLFAEDTCLFITVDNGITSSNAINDDLRAIQHWSDELLVTFSAPKTKSMIVSRKRDAHVYPPLSFDNSVVGDMSNHKHLGIVLSNDLGWARPCEDLKLYSHSNSNLIEMHLNSFTCPLYFQFWNMLMSCGRDHLTAIWKNLTKFICAQ